MDLAQWRRRQWQTGEISKKGKSYPGLAGQAKWKEPSGREPPSKTGQALGQTSSKQVYFLLLQVFRCDRLIDLVFHKVR
jgi:hypothetical protein